MKRAILLSAAAMIFASCTREGVMERPAPDANSGVAYLSIGLNAGASDGNPGADGADGPDKLYLVTFDGDGRVTSLPGASRCYTPIDMAAQTDARNPDPVRVSAASKNLVVIADPDARQTAAITGLTSADTFLTFSRAVEAATAASEAPGRGNSPMITECCCGADVYTMCPCLAIGDRLRIVSGTLSEEAARTNSAASRLTVTLAGFDVKEVVTEL